MAQPAVSAQIRSLERELGEPLFHRDRRAVTLTAAGEALLPHARAALSAAERGRDTIASLRGMLHGRLRIGVAGPVDRRLAATLGDFHRAHPAVEIVLTQDHRDPLVSAVADGDVDAAVVGIGIGSMPPNVRVRQLAVEPLVVGVARRHPLSRRKQVALRELREHPMIALTRGSGLRTLLERACRDAGYVPRIAAETGELASLVDLAAEGLGVAVLPRSAADGADLTLLELTRPRLQRRTGLAWNEAGASPAARAFLALAEQHFDPAYSSSARGVTRVSAVGTAGAVRCRVPPRRVLPGSVPTGAGPRRQRKEPGQAGLFVEGSAVLANRRRPAAAATTC